MEGLTEGRVVHYTAYNKRCLAAMVTGTSTVGAPTVDLVVFTNMENVNGVKSGGVQFHFGVHHSPTAEPGTWHWPNQGEAGH